MLIDRIITHKIKKYLSEQGEDVILLYGPRQAGKTTIIKEILEQIGDYGKYFSGDDLAAQEIFSRNELENLKRHTEQGKIIIIDEAQRIANIGLSLKLMRDEIGARVIASGSASFDLADKISEPLTGRTRTFMLYPLAYEEIKSRYAGALPDTMIDELLRFGMFPRVHTLGSNKEKENYLYEYTNNYLYKDILAFSGVRKPKKAVDLLSLLALQIGSEVRIFELAQNLAISQQSVSRYLEIFEKMFVLVNLRGFSRNLRKEISKTSKYFFLDLGLRNALIRNFNPLNLRADAGALFENFFIIEKIKKSANRDQPANFYFWRTYDQKEIDLIEERGGKLIGYECKFSARKEIKPPKDWLAAYENAEFKPITTDNFAGEL
ncbi:ATP-binding protein [Candidatus Parcubacteria bacterium]|nr:ATP-binding protein [Patescibacteria group bacterium]MCG2690576.1 ATP-binding protein [Candidatus Parcubacteria bacterium]